MEDMDIGTHLCFDPLPSQLDGNFCPVCECRFVNLSDRGRSDRFSCKALKGVPGESSIKNTLHRCIIHRRKFIMQCFECVEILSRKKVASGSEHLSELDKTRTQLGNGIEQCFR